MEILTSVSNKVSNKPMFDFLINNIKELKDLATKLFNDSNITTTNVAKVTSGCLICFTVAYYV